jgi:hypothetical protein
MRTKTLLFTAALAAAGVISSVAADVTSSNIVGYVNKDINAGFTLIGNPLNSGGNTLGTVFPADLNLGTILYRYVNGAFTLATFEEQDDGSKNFGANNNDVLNPGEGVFIFNPGAARKVTFVGEVPLGAALNNNIAVGFNLKSSIVPQAGQLDTVLGYPAAAGDVAYLLKTDGTYSTHSFAEQDDGSLGWDVPPVPGVGEGFWILSVAAKTWTRSFTMADTN